MTQIFIDPSDISGDTIRVTGEDSHHLRDVLRIRTGEHLYVVCRENGMRYECSVSESGRDGVLCRITDAQRSQSELPVRITLFQGMPKSDKFEFVIQKAVELGACRVVPVMMARSVVKLHDSKLAGKTERWNKIAASAAEQSMRDTVPVVSAPLSFTEALAEAGDCDAILLPYELAEGMDETREILEDIRSEEPQDIAVFIGPEGGFDEKEVEQAVASGARVITLGRRILRTETAPLVILSWLTYIFEKDPVRDDSDILPEEKEHI